MICPPTQTRATSTVDAPTQDQLRRRGKPLGSRVGRVGRPGCLIGGARAVPRWFVLSTAAATANRGRPQTSGIAGHLECMHSAALAASACAMLVF